MIRDLKQQYVEHRHYSAVCTRPMFPLAQPLPIRPLVPIRAQPPPADLAHLVLLHVHIHVRSDRHLRRDRPVAPQLEHDRPQALRPTPRQHIHTTHEEALTVRPRRRCCSTRRRSGSARARRGSPRPVALSVALALGGGGRGLTLTTMTAGRPSIVCSTGVVATRPTSVCANVARNLRTPSAPAPRSPRALTRRGSRGCRPGRAC